MVWSFTILKGKKIQVVWLYQGMVNVPTTSVSHFKITWTIKCAPQQFKRAKQKGIQAANSELPYVLENWGSSRGGNMLWGPHVFKSKQDEQIVVGLSVCIQDKVVEILAQNFTKEKIRSIVINLSQQHTIET